MEYAASVWNPHLYVMFSNVKMYRSVAYENAQSTGRVLLRASGINRGTIPSKLRVILLCV